MNMNIIVYFRKYFAEGAKEAAIPGLGVFYIATDQDGQVQILFKEKTPKSKAFVNFLAFEENITEAECLEKIAQWKSVIVKSLKETSIATIPELGTFEVKDKVVYFYPSADQFANDERYGLEEVEAGEPLEEEVMEDDTNQEDDILSNSESAAVRSPRCLNKKRNLLWGVLGVLLIGIALVFILPASRATVLSIFSFGASEPTQISFPEQIENESVAMDQESPMEEAEDVVGQEEVELAIKSSGKEVVDNEEEEIVSVKKEQISKPRSKEVVVKQSSFSPSQKSPVKGRFYIIVGGFSKVENAKKEAAKWNNASANPEILFVEERNIYYVSINSFTNRTQAQDYKPTAQKITGNASCWVYSK